jgi:hypothetical protein
MGGAFVVKLFLPDISSGILYYSADWWYLASRAVLMFALSELA